MATTKTTKATKATKAKSDKASIPTETTARCNADNVGALPPVTQWFLFSDQKPWEKGEYDIVCGDPAGQVLRSAWDGEKWGRTYNPALVGSQSVLLAPFAPVTFWRGLSRPFTG